MSDNKSAFGKGMCESNTVEVLDSTIHYIESGQGDPILFIHGMPTYSYLWRNVIPGLKDSGRCIALDLIGMGLSGKPDIDYRVFDHIKYVTEFIEVMDLKNITLVMHGWGSVIGFEYARLHPENVKSMAFFESHVRPTTEWDMLSLPVQQLASLLQRQGASYRAILQQNYLVKKLLPKGVIRKLSQKELAVYEKPFPTPLTRKPLWQYVNDLPLGNGPDDVIELIAEYSAWLQKTDIPKLMLYAMPGFITPISTVTWAKDNFPQLTVVGLDDVMHFAQESVPELFSQSIRQWHDSLFVR